MSVIVILGWVALQFYFTLIGMRNVIENPWPIADDANRRPATQY